MNIGDSITVRSPHGDIPAVVLAWPVEGDTCRYRVAQTVGPVHENEIYWAHIDDVEVGR
jgi:hypothetical protein